MAHLRIPYEVFEACGRRRVKTRILHSLRSKAANMLFDIIESAWNAEKGVTGFATKILIDKPKDWDDFWVAFLDLVETFEDYDVDKREKTALIMLANRYNRKIRVVIKVLQNYADQTEKRGRSNTLVMVDEH